MGVYHNYVETPTCLKSSTYEYVLETIDKYLKNRPDLNDVSIKPKLVIKGNPHPTGTKQT